MNKNTKIFFKAAIILALIGSSVFFFKRFDSSAGYTMRARQLIEQGQDVEALPLLDQALTRNPDDKEALFERGLLRERIHQFEGALEDLNRAVTDKPDSALLFLARGEAYRELQKYDLALEDMNKAISLKPDFAANYAARAEVYSKQNLYDKAIADCSQAVKLDPKDLEGITACGEVHTAMHEYAKAIDDYTQALTFKPDDPDIFAFRAAAEMGAAQQDKALVDLNHALRLDPHNMSAQANRAALDLASNDYDAGIKDLNEAMQVNAGMGDAVNADYIFERGQAELFTNKIDAAIDDLEKAQSVDHVDAYKVMWLHIGHMHAGQDDKDELAKNASPFLNDTWPGPVVAFYTGKTSIDDLMGKAKTGTDVIQANQLCEAHYYVGEDQLAKKATYDAHKSFQAALDVCPPDFAELAASRAELKAMGP